MNTIEKRLKHITCLLLLITLLMPCGDLLAQCTLTATSSNSTVGNIQVYVLVDDSNNIVAENSTGTFTAVPNGNYTIHALNYDDSGTLPDPLPSALIGSPVSDVGSNTLGCFNANFLTDFVNRSCSDCVKTEQVCEGDPISASSSNSTSGNTQIYVLADDSDNFLFQNTTGIFPTGTLTTGNTYQVHALNYDDNNEPTTLPSALNVGDPLSDITGGCFNSDFLTDYVCFEITTCSCTPTAICQGDPISATSSGSTTGNIQVYVLADDNSNFVAQNLTGTFPTGALTAGIYQVHALNYDDNNEPTTLPSALNVGDPLSDITGGCFNGNFLTDYVCFTITVCACTPTLVCINNNITVTSSGSTVGNTQVYVLADDSGNFISYNGTGIFPAASLTPGNIYHLHALNYDPNDIPTTLPDDLNPGDPISDITGGCFNADFLTDYVCVEIDCSCNSNVIFLRG